MPSDQECVRIFAPPVARTRRLNARMRGGNTRNELRLTRVSSRRELFCDETALAQLAQRARSYGLTAPGRRLQRVARELEPVVPLLAGRAQLRRSIAELCR